MRIGSRIVFTTLTMGLVIATCSFSSLAQEPTKKSTQKADPAPVVSKKGDSSRRVPNYFNQIGINSEQRESIYKIRKTHQEKIDALKKQITESEAKSLAECEAVLTDTQKKLLDNLRVGAAKTSSKSAETTKPAAK